MFQRCSLHGVMLSAVTHFLRRKECPKASEILWGYYFQIQIYALCLSFQKVSMRERVKTFKLHLITTQIRPIAHILVVVV